MSHTNPDLPSDRAPSISDYLGVSIYWFALSFLWGALLAMVLPSMVEQIAGRDGKDHALALVLAVGAAVAGVTQIASGALSDSGGGRWGKRKPYLAVGTVLACAALLVFPYAHSFGSILCAYVALQFLLNIAIGPYQAMIPDIIAPGYYGRASAWMGIWTLLGRIGGPLTASRLLGKADGSKHLFWLFSIMLLSFMLTNLALAKEPPSRPSGRSLSETLASVYRVELRPYPSFVWLMISRFGIMMGSYTVLAFLFYYVKYTLGLATDAATYRTISTFMVVATLTGFAGMLPAGMLSDSRSKKMVMFGANAVCIAAAVGFVVSADVAAATIAVAVFGVGFAAFIAVDWALGCDLIPEHSRARYLGVWGLSDTIPQVVAPLIAGPVAAWVNKTNPPGGGYRITMMLAIAYFIVGTLTLVRVRERTRFADERSGH